jgi:hypothetical protein
MKKLKFNSFFRSIFILAMSLFLSFDITNAQNSATAGTPTSLIDGFTTTTSVKVKAGDTVVMWYQYAADTSFAGATDLPKRVLTKDTIIRDTFTVSKHLLPPTDTTGYTLWLRPMRIFVKAKDTGFVKPYQSVIVYPKPGVIKIYNFLITPTSYGCVVSFFGRAGSQYETVNLTYSYNYPTDTVWRTPTPKNGKFTGNTSFSQNITGILSNRKINFRVYKESSVDTFNTVVTFTTTPTSTKPVVAEGSGKSATADSAFIVVDGTSFNQPSKFVCINTANNDTLTKTIASTKTESLIYRFGNVTGNTKYTFKTYSTNSMGTSNVVYITITTPPALVQPKFNALTPDVRWDFDNHQFFIYAKVDGLTNSQNKAKRVDVLIYIDSLKKNTPTSFLVVNGLSAIQGPWTSGRINSDSGRFWYEFLVETEKGIYTSTLLGYNVGWAQVPKSTLSIRQIKMAVGSTECKLYDLSGKLISTSYNVDPKVNLFDSNLPHGILIAVPVDNFKPFRTFNHQ